MGYIQVWQILAPPIEVTQHPDGHCNFQLHCRRDPCFRGCWARPCIPTAFHMYILIQLIGSSLIREQVEQVDYWGPDILCCLSPITHWYLALILSTFNTQIDDQSLQPPVWRPKWFELEWPWWLVTPIDLPREDHGYDVIGNCTIPWFMSAIRDGSHANVCKWFTGGWDTKWLGSCQRSPSWPNSRQWSNASIAVVGTIRGTIPLPVYPSPSS